MSKTWVAMMRVRINESRNNSLALRVDHLSGSFGQHWRLTERNDFTAADCNISINKTARRPNLAVLNQQLDIFHGVLDSPFFVIENFLYGHTLTVSTVLDSIGEI